ncbi:MAG: alpha-amylase family glycosyl hydrolase [Candidatus Bathyarchaeia archaeon]
MMISDKTERRMLEKLTFLYGDDRGRWAYAELIELLKRFSNQFKPRISSERFSEKDVVLIAYADMIRNDAHPIRALTAFAKKYLKGKVNTIHLLPFIRYDSDRGFSIIDYREVDSRIGDWSDIAELKKNFKLMVDLVLNHVSDKHFWFQEFRKGNPQYRDYFIWFDESTLPSKELLERVVRPRLTPILSRYETVEGEKFVWTTFPHNQVDLNYRNERVLLEMVDIMLFYVSKGADIIRLDAVPYLWKELGTSCLNLKQAHLIVQLLRDILNAVAPHVSILVEANVHHKDNVQYFGDGRNEAHIVYNFTLPPLLIHAFYTEDASHLSKLVGLLENPSGETTYLNILDTHDGIGLLSVKDVLTDREIEKMVKKSVENGGLVSNMRDPDGGESPYEMNTTWWCALQSTYLSIKAETDTLIKRYLASRAIALSLKGVPAIYLNGLLGALNDLEGAKRTGYNRDINRRNFNLSDLLREIEDKNSRTHSVFYGYLNLIKRRVGERVFHPNGEQKVLFLNKSVFAVARVSPDKGERVIALHNLSDRRRKVRLGEGTYRDLISQRKYSKDVKLEPYQVCWLKRN